MKNIIKKLKYLFIKIKLKLKGIDIKDLYDLIIQTKTLEELKTKIIDISMRERLENELYDDSKLIL